MENPSENLIVHRRIVVRNVIALVIKGIILVVNDCKCIRTRLSPTSRDFSWNSAGLSHLVHDHRSKMRPDAVKIGW